jgi:hypothetical protein
MSNLNENAIKLIAAASGIEQAVFSAVESNFNLLDIRTILPNAPLGEVIRAWLLCYRIPIQQPGNPHQQWVLMKVSEVLYGEGEEIEGLTLPQVLDRFAPWLRSPKPV